MSLSSLACERGVAGHSLCALHSRGLHCQAGACPLAGVLQELMNRVNGYCWEQERLALTSDRAAACVADGSALPRLGGATPCTPDKQRRHRMHAVGARHPRTYAPT